MDAPAASLQRVLLVTGSRTIHQAAVVNAVLDQVVDAIRPTCLMHGGARGVDQLAGAWATARGLAVRVVRPDLVQWPVAAFGPGKAYVMRDLAMVIEAHVVVGIWDGTSKGTRHTVKEAKRLNKLHGVWDQDGFRRPG